MAFALLASMEWAFMGVAGAVAGLLIGVPLGYSLHSLNSGMGGVMDRDDSDSDEASKPLLIRVWRRVTSQLHGWFS